MKKYTLILFAFIFVFGLFAFNMNSVSAYDSGCSSAGPYSSTTGKLCVADTAVVTCPTGDLFSSLTGQRCTAWQGNSNSSDVVQFNSLFRSYFAVGARGEDVRSLQQFLKNQGYYFGIIDGKYGNITARAVSDFRDDNNISVAVNIPTSTSPTNTSVSNLTITTTSPLPNAKVGQLYSTNLIATGGTGFYGWDTGSAYNNVFPPGLALGINNSDTTSIIGTPTTTGTYTFTLIATSGSQSLPKQFTLTVDPATTTSINHAPRMTGSGGYTVVQVGQYANFYFTATDADNDNLLWSVDWGDGSRFNNSSGTTANAFNTSRLWNTTGTYNGTVSLSDGRGGTDIGSFQVVVAVDSSTNTSGQINPGVISAIFPLPAGCTNDSAYNATSGIDCSYARVGDTVYLHGSNFKSNSGIFIDGGTYSNSATFISSSQLSFVVPFIPAGNHTIQVVVQSSQPALLSNSLYLNIK